MAWKDLLNRCWDNEIDYRPPFVYIIERLVNMSLALAPKLVIPDHIQADIANKGKTALSTSLKESARSINKLERKFEGILFKVC